MKVVLLVLFFFTRTVYIILIWHVKEKMTDILFVEKKKSFTNSSKAAFYSGNLMHTEVGFLDQVTFLTLVCEDETQIYL